MRTNRIPGTGRMLLAAIALALIVLPGAQAFATEVRSGLSLDLPPASSPALLPRDVGAESVASAKIAVALGVHKAQLDAFLEQQDTLPTTLAAQATTSDVALPFQARYYWVGNIMVIDGWVDNDTANDTGIVLVGVVVRNDVGQQIASTITAASIYNLKPGRSATFRGIIDSLGAYAGTNMNVSVETLGIQPTIAPDAVDLTFVSGDGVVDAEGVRRYACTFRNDSAVEVRDPLLGGVELDAAGDIHDVVSGVAEDAVLAPGASVTIEGLSLLPGVTPATTQVYAQAYPVPLSTPTPVYRFYNMRNGTHFYTPSAEERDQIQAALGATYRFEGIAYHTNPGTNPDPLFRFFYKRGGSHFYTADEDEAALIMNRWPHIFTFEGKTYPVNRFKTEGAVEVYRFLNRKNSSHFYTSSAAERDHVRSALSGTYIFEGVAFYVAP